MGLQDTEYRVALYPAYHAHREPMPPELAVQWELAPALLASFGWTVGATETLEADDVMFSFARAEAEAGGRALLMTADRDLYGAVCERVAVIDVRKDGNDAEIGPAGVRERYGVVPELVPDFIALRGDPSDGLPGASGVGPKTAAELLRVHGSLEGAIAGARQERPRIAQALTGQADELRAFREIAELRTVDLERPSDRATDLAGGAKAARGLGLNRLAERLENAADVGDL
jgi:DNA polymerase-1